MLTNVDYTFPTVGPDYRKKDNRPTISHSAWNRRQGQNRPSALMDVYRFVLGLYIGLPRLIRSQVRLKACQGRKGSRATKLRNIGDFSARQAQIVRNPARHRRLNSHRRISAPRRHSPSLPSISAVQARMKTVRDVSYSRAERRRRRRGRGRDSSRRRFCIAFRLPGQSALRVKGPEVDPAWATHTAPTEGNTTKGNLAAIRRI